MATSEHKYLSDFARKYYGEGKAEGLVAGKAEALLSFLSARDLAASPEQRRIILECADPSRLDRWIARAVAVESVDILLSGS